MALWLYGHMALWLCGHTALNLFKANELETIWQSISIQEAWTGVEHSVDCFDLTNEAIKPYAVI